MQPYGYRCFAVFTAHQCGVEKEENFKNRWMWLLYGYLHLFYFGANGTKFLLIFNAIVR